jgi:hypothetical protein
MIARLRMIAESLGMTPSDGIRVEADGGIPARWWITGCEEPERELPMSAGAEDVFDALDACELWLGIDDVT